MALIDIGGSGEYPVELSELLKKERGDTGKRGVGLVK